MLKKSFQELSKNELYAIAKLRQDVFIIEQNSIYVDLDDLDQQSIHYLLKEADGQLFGYARYRVIENKQQVKIERVVFDKAHRGLGLGQKLLRRIIEDIQQQCPDNAIQLSAQLEACDFYQQLGFKQFGDVFDDGGIAHISMQYQS